ncbi:GNAT family N-acetyltransferase [Paenibacillus chibensis]|uniref:GNAT family N-acetyltransferase n=1 Tax=Paenibacillus chibensis TaxID=59846 RepID=A0ABU6PRA9_9BACL|nr:GNAT family N-acetyltransferase [Paenibacillus chibensis]
MKSAVVREIRVADYPDIYLLNQAFNPRYAVFSEEKVKKKIETILQHTEDIIFVYEENSQVGGYIHGSPYELLFSEAMVNVLGFVVQENHRRRGVGSALIEKLEQWGRNNGFNGIKLLSHPSRTAAHRLYEQRGYRFTKDQKNYIKTFE